MFEHLEALELTTGTNDKIQILQTLDADEQTLVRLALDPSFVFHIKEIGDTPVPVLPNEEPPEIRLALFLELCEKLAAKKGLTWAERAQVTEFLSRMPTKLEFKWFRRVLLKDLRCGVDRGLFNKALPDFPIEVHGCALADVFNPEKHDVAGRVADVKLDGVRGMGHHDDAGTLLYSRSGKRITTFDHIMAELPAGLPGVFDGEIWLPGTNGFQTLMTYVKKRTPAPIHTGIRYVLFDFVMADEWGAPVTAPYAERRELLKALLVDKFGPGKPYRGKELITLYGDHLAMTECATVRDLRHAMDLLDYFIAEGFEGVMLKDPGAAYKVKRSSDIWKLKRFYDLEARVLSWLPGTGKYEGMLGALMCAMLEDERKIFKVGSGFDDQQRADLWAQGADAIVKRLVTVKYQELSKDGIPRFPVFQRFREDQEAGL